MDADLLLIIASTADELYMSTNIDDLERPWTRKLRPLRRHRCGRLAVSIVSGCIYRFISVSNNSLLCLAVLSQAHVRTVGDR